MNYFFILPFSGSYRRGLCKDGTGSGEAGAAISIAGKTNAQAVAGGGVSCGNTEISRCDCGFIPLSYRVVIVSLSSRCRLVAVMLCVLPCVISRTAAILSAFFFRLLEQFYYRYFTATSPLTRKLRIEISKKIERLRYRNIGISGYRDIEKPRSDQR